MSLDFQIEPHNSMKLQTGQQRIHQITSVTAPQSQVMLKSNVADAAAQHSFSPQQFFTQNKHSQQPAQILNAFQSSPQAHSGQQSIPIQLLQRQNFLGL